MRVVVPFPAGGGIDIIARHVTQKLSEAFGMQFVVDNRGGAGGAIGTENVARVAPDGYSLLFSSTSPMSINPHINKVKYDPLTSFAPVSMIGFAPEVLVVHPSLPVKSVKELIALAKARPGELFYSSGGNGAAAHLAGELFNSMSGIRVAHVPYKGVAAALIAVLSGETQVTFGSQPTALPHVKQGRLRPLAVTSAKRSPFTPGLPSLAEAALPGYEVTTWFGFLAPAAVPPDVVRELHSATTRALRDPDVHSIVAAQGGDIVASTGPEFGAFIKAELNKWAAIIKWSGATAE